MSSVIDVSVLDGSKLSEPLEIPASLQVLEGSQQPQPGQGAFRILSPKFGDQRITWHNNSLAEISDARKLFEQLVAKGLTAYRVGVDGQRTSEVMKEFDPAAEEIVFVPGRLVAGG